MMSAPAISTLMLGAARLAHRLGAWIFDRSGVLAPAFARCGEPLNRWFFPHSALADADVPVEIDGLRLFHEGRSSYHLQMLVTGMHDREVARALRDLVRPGMTIVDVGAHIGYFTLLGARLGGPTSDVWAFEPHPELVPILRRNVAENDCEDHVHVRQEALGDGTGDAALFPGAGDSMLSSLHPTAAATDRPERVRCTTLDAWAEGLRWPAVDLVKVDVEGHEVAVLAGMREVVRRNPTIVLIVEFNERTLAAAGETADSFLAGLAGCGLDRFSIAGPRARQLVLPRDLAVLRKESARNGNDRVNLICSGARASAADRL